MTIVAVTLGVISLALNLVTMTRLDSMDVEVDVAKGLSRRALERTYDQRKQ